MEKDGTFELKDNLRDTLSDQRHHGRTSHREPKSDQQENIRTVDDEEEDKEHLQYVPNNNNEDELKEYYNHD